jgi:hypothetical protein
MQLIKGNKTNLTKEELFNIYDENLSESAIQKQIDYKKNARRFLFQGHDIKKDYNFIVPRELKSNLIFRYEIVKRINASDKFAQDMWDICQRDILFFVNVFCWTYNPRLKCEKNVPFILYPFQETAILKIKRAITKGEDILIEKSRDVGASWICLIPIVWFFLFIKDSSFGLTSRTQDLVDKTDDPDCLFWKIDFIIKNLPDKFKPNVKRNLLQASNKNIGTTIGGYSTTSDSARAGRRTAMLLDEFASVKDAYEILTSTGDVTSCRILNSTPKGINNAFYDRVKDPFTTKIKIHWSLHPVKNKGLYKSIELSDNKMKLIILDRGYRFPKGYKFILDGKIRSVWYDKECKRRTKLEIAQELDINYLGSGSNYFELDVINQYKDLFCCEPIQSGFIFYEYFENTLSNINFKDDKDGKFTFWEHLNLGTPVDKLAEYCIACDTSAGTGASNSVLTIGNIRTNEKIGEYVDAYIKPFEFARLAVSTAKLFNNAFLIWETNGAGREFGDEVLRLGYKNIYYKMSGEGTYYTKMTEIPGWFPTVNSKLSLLGTYRQALNEHTFIDRSVMTLREAEEYVYSTNGGVEFGKTVNMPDPSGSKANHGDRVISSALLLYAIRIYASYHKKEESNHTNYSNNCIHARQQERLKLAKKGYWD